MAKPKQKWKLHSNMRAAKHAGEEALGELIALGTQAMEETAKQRIKTQAGRRGYNLSPDQLRVEHHPLEGEISLEEPYWRFFEYGTTFIAAMPSIRPGYRAGRKVVKNEGAAKAIFGKWMKRRAEIRR